ncbi:hypothetical protein LXA47_03810 [Massilia sp. P8910]|uniref:hypothetical protein n=1 Tax=Massilia antarctica TaxID=2765360 RepID=UPI001E3F06C6|nr:hypothetical protein [Massilia antarctica]MCE3602724.1 hypothetical protein [Massilia antarctica]
MQIIYFKVDGFDGKYFNCERYGTLSPASCAKNFASAPESTRTSGRLEACVGCLVGQQHADPAAAPKAAPATATSFSFRQVCVRCRRGGHADNNRLIGRMRLVRDHTTCVSCYNREREVIQGKNAKGARPKKWRHLFYVQIGSVSDGSLTIEAFDHPVRDRLEAMLTMLRRKTGPKVMAWTASRSIMRAEVAL